MKAAPEPELALTASAELSGLSGACLEEALLREAGTFGARTQTRKLQVQIQVERGQRLPEGSGCAQDGDQVALQVLDGIEASAGRFGCHQELTHNFKLFAPSLRSPRLRRTQSKTKQ